MHSHIIMFFKINPSVKNIYKRCIAQQTDERNRVPLQVQEMKVSKCTCQWQPAGGPVSTTAAWPESMDLLRRARRAELPMTLCTNFTPNITQPISSTEYVFSVLSPTLPKHLCTAFWLYSTQTSKSTLPGESRWTYPKINTASFVDK